MLYINLQDNCAEKNEIVYVWWVGIPDNHRYLDIIKTYNIHKKYLKHLI